MQVFQDLKDRFPGIIQVNHNGGFTFQFRVISLIADDEGDEFEYLRQGRGRHEHKGIGDFDAPVLNSLQSDNLIAATVPDSKTSIVQQLYKLATFLSPLFRIARNPVQVAEDTR